MMAKLRAGLIGYGSMGRNHARVLRSLENVELIGIADSNIEAEDEKIFRSVEELIKLKPDYCVVATPTLMHEEVAIKLAEAGIHALIEKPLAPSGASAKRIAEVFTLNGVIGAVGHIERYNPALQEARKRITHGQIGNLLQIATRRQGPFPGRISDVGVIKDLATHDIDLTSWISGSPFSTVSAQIAYRSGRPHEDMLCAIGELKDGTITSHVVNWLSPFKERITVLTGEKGTLVADTLMADLTFYANGTFNTEWSELARFRGVSEGDSVRYAFAKPEPLRSEHEQFRNAVSGRDAEIVTLEQGLQTVLVAESMMTSARNSQTIVLGENNK
jgi:predicted dehydrogenase